MRFLCPFCVLVTIACSGDTAILRGTVEDATGAPWDGTVLVEAVHLDVWRGEEPKDDGDLHEATVDDAQFRFEVAPETYAVLATAGTCNSSPPQEIEVSAGDDVEVTLVVTCVE